jgi:hypothetical protein
MRGERLDSSPGAGTGLETHVPNRPFAIDGRADERRRPLKRAFVGVGLVLVMDAFLGAENLTIYIGKSKAQFAGVTIGGDIWDFLQLQVDVMKYLKDDTSLHSDDPKLNRGDFLGASVNVVLKLPLHIIPYLDQFDFIQPYLTAGHGFASENLTADYNNLPNPGDNKTGIFNKLWSFNSFGVGLIIMISPQFGLKVDYRSIDLAAQTGLNLPARSFGRTSFGICFGKYKNDVVRIKT